MVDLSDIAVSALDSKMGLELLEVSAERTVGRVPVVGNTQPLQMWHGGASCVLAETLASVAATFAAGEGRVAYGIEINASHHKSVREGHVTGTATALRVGRNLLSYAVKLVDDSGNLICTARVTCMAQPRPSDG